MGKQFTSDDPRAAASGRKQAAVYKAKYRHVPAKKQPPKVDPGTWWIGKDRASFAQEIAEREKARQAHEAAISYKRPMEY